jgi:hypothetical protein
MLVSCNTTSIGGFSQLLVDDGTHGDAAAGDSVFSYLVTVDPAAAAGPRSLQCVVSDDQGRIGLATIALQVTNVSAENLPPTVDAGGPYAVDEGSSVTLTAAGSDPDGGALSYAWDLDGDGVYETAGQSVSFAPDDGPASRTVSVRATDPAGLSAAASASVAVHNVAPTAAFSAPAGADVGSSFTLSLTGAADPSAADTAAGFTYAFDCGAGYGPFTSSASASCAAGDVGPAAVGAIVRDKDGGRTEYRSTVSVTASADALCALTRSLTDKQQVADALCVKLRHGSYGAYVNQLAGQSGAEPGKAFDSATAARLAALALTL